MSGVRVAVVGGGISGLTAAHVLTGAGHDVTLFDDAAQPGGLIRSERRDGFLCERGPHSLLDGAEEVRALLASAGLTGRAQSALPAARRRFVYVDGALRPFPASPPELFTTSLLSARGKMRLLAERFVGRPAAVDPEESVFDFVARRFGPEAARRGAGTGADWHLCGRRGRHHHACRLSARGRPRERTRQHPARHDALAR